MTNSDSTTNACLSNPLDVAVNCHGQKNTTKDKYFPYRNHRMTASNVCAHIRAVTTVRTAQRHECAECVAMGARWVHLRTCQECGVTLRCDSSPNRHATKHAHATGHPVIASAEPGERWMYCYPDDAFVEY